MTKKISLTKINLGKRDGCKHPDIVPGRFYLAKIDSRFYAGQFTHEWYGWNFDAVYDAGIQLDDGDWQGLWLIGEK